MVINRNSIMAEEIRDVFKLQQNVDGIISNVAGQIIPVVDVNPKHSRISNFFASNAAVAATILTTATDRDTYITACSLGVSKTAADTGTTAHLRTTINGVSTTNLLTIPGITLTANQQVVTISFPTPIKVDRGVPIATIGSNITLISANIVGYTVENIKA